MPYYISTIQDHIDFDYEVTAHCGRHHPHCAHSETLDLKALRKKLGPDYPVIANDAFLRYLVCGKCGHKGGVIRVSARYLSSTQAREAMEKGMRERYVARPNMDRPGLWEVYDRLKETVYSNDEGRCDDLDMREARELADILNDPVSFYATDEA